MCACCLLTSPRSQRYQKDTVVSPTSTSSLEVDQPLKILEGEGRGNRTRTTTCAPAPASNCGSTTTTRNNFANLNKTTDRAGGDKNSRFVPAAKIMLQQQDQEGRPDEAEQPRQKLQQQSDAFIPGMSSSNSSDEDMSAGGPGGTAINGRVDPLQVVHDDGGPAQGAASAYNNATTLTGNSAAAASSSSPRKKSNLNLSAPATTSNGRKRLSLDIHVPSSPSSRGGGTSTSNRLVNNPSDDTANSTSEVSLSPVSGGVGGHNLNSKQSTTSQNIGGQTFGAFSTTHHSKVSLSSMSMSLGGMSCNYSDFHTLQQQTYDYYIFDFDNLISSVMLGQRQTATDLHYENFNAAAQLDQQPGGWNNATSSSMLGPAGDYNSATPNTGMGNYMLSASSDRKSRRRENMQPLQLDNDLPELQSSPVPEHANPNKFTLDSIEEVTAKEFGGQERVMLLHELFTKLQQKRKQFWILSRGREARIKIALKNVGLLKFFENGSTSSGGAAATSSTGSFATSAAVPPSTRLVATPVQQRENHREEVRTPSNHPLFDADGDATMSTTGSGMVTADRPPPGGPAPVLDHNIAAPPTNYADDDQDMLFQSMSTTANNNNLLNMSVSAPLAIQPQMLLIDTAAAPAAPDLMQPEQADARPFYTPMAGAVVTTTGNGSSGGKHYTNNPMDLLLPDEHATTPGAAHTAGNKNKRPPPSPLGSVKSGASGSSPNNAMTHGGSNVTNGPRSKHNYPVQLLSKTQSDYESAFSASTHSNSPFLTPLNTHFDLKQYDSKARILASDTLHRPKGFYKAEQIVNLFDSMSAAGAEHVAMESSGANLENDSQQHPAPPQQVLGALGTTTTAFPDAERVLFLDDNKGNLELAENTVTVYQPRAGMHGTGLSLVEIKYLISALENA
ncbi:unnamed protein product [Amoebophrya sp. A120]|nr:unnamed protein product [Amoebophrya sp. A120]|eukprot:GSA120T00014832001.1